MFRIFVKKKKKKQINVAGNTPKYFDNREPLDSRGR